jgi:hypothetical protein
MGNSDRQICRQDCDTLLHVVYTLQCSRGVRDSLDAEMLYIATGEALVYIVFPPSGKLGVGEVMRPIGNRLKTKRGV